MYVYIGNSGQGKTYNTTRNLQFAPEVDVSGLSASIDFFEIDIQTTDKINVGTRATLSYEGYVYSDFFITEVDQIDNHFIRIRAESELLWLDKKIMPATMYNNELLSFVLSDITEGTPVQIQWDDVTYNTIVVNGFCPKQTARERLIEVAFSIGAFIRCSYDNTLRLDSIDEISPEVMDYDHIFYRPSITYKNWVTSIALTRFNFDTPTGEAGEETVTDANGVSYKVIRTVDKTINSFAPSTAPQNEVVVDNCMLVRNANAGSIIMRLADYYFNRMEISLDCINNSQMYKAGKKYRTFIDEGIMVEGWCERASYKQGVQTRATLILSGGQSISSGTLTVKYVSADSPPGNVVIGTRMLTFPVGYGFQIENPWIDITVGDNVYYFRPSSDILTGYIDATTKTITVQCYVCLVHNTKTGVLKVISVDGVTSKEVTDKSTQIQIASISPADGSGYKQTVERDVSDPDTIEEGSGTGTGEGSGTGTGEGSGTGTGEGSGEQEEEEPYIRQEHGNLDTEAVLISDDTYVPNNAYLDNQTLTSISFSLASKIGRSAFCYCENLETADFPVCKTIKREAFEWCFALSQISFPICETIEGGAFDRCSSLTTLDFPSCKSIGGAGFKDCKGITTVSFPVCETIGNNAFEWAISLTSAYFPVCTSIGTGAFEYCSSLSIVDLPVCSRIGERAFAFASVETINIPECEYIPKSAFWQCNLKSIYIPKCSYIEELGFQGNSQLSQIYASDCTFIGEMAFNGCGSLTGEFSMPLCSSIGVEAFLGCRNLPSVYFPLVKAVPEQAFERCESLSIANIESCEVIGYQAFYNCFALLSAYFPECKAIADSAFYSCSSLAIAYFPKCTFVGERAFFRCSNLTSINFEECKEVGSHAFIGCQASELSFPKCSKIGKSAFAGNHLANIAYFPLLKSIPERAFHNCSSLHTVTLSSCSKIWDGAFYKCSNLTSIYLMGSKVCYLDYEESETFKETPLENNNSAYTKIYVPSSLYSSYINAWTSYYNCFVSM